MNHSGTASPPRRNYNSPYNHAGCSTDSASLQAFISARGLPPNPNRSTTPNSGRIYLAVSVDWEGRDIQALNLSAMNRFRDQFPNLPLLQFMNAAYFTKPNANAASLSQQMRSVIRPGDELGVHIHGWRNLFQAAGVTFRSSPSVWHEDEIVHCGLLDCGHEVAISEYTTEELRRVLRYSRDTLIQNGFNIAGSFRAGAWIASDRVIDALVAEGFTLESSAVAISLMESRMRWTHLYHWLSSMWSSVTSTSQPCLLRSSGQSGQNPQSQILEFPDNGALADWVTSEQMVATYRAVESIYRQDPSKNYFVHIGFHQETAESYVNLVEAAIRGMMTDAQTAGIPFEFARYPITQYLN